MRMFRKFKMDSLVKNMICGYINPQIKYPWDINVFLEVKN